MPVRRILLPLAMCAMLFAANASTARGLVVIVNPDSGVDALSRDDAVNIFMGRYRKLPSGIAALPIDIGGSNPRRKQFYALLLNRDLADIDAYWARLVFSGQTSPPQQVADDKTAVRLVAGNRNAIAYVDGDEVDRRVKVVLELEPR
jgi:hypothetical protein